MNSSTEVLTAHLKLEVGKLRRALRQPLGGQAQLPELIELHLEGFEVAASEDDCKNWNEEPARFNAGPPGFILPEGHMQL